MSDYRMVYITTATKDEALAIGRELVERRLVACANVLPGMRSIYCWKGELHEESEAVLIVKTAADRVEAVTEAVKALHPYECPCIVSIPIEPGNAAYFKWLGESLE